MENKSFCATALQIKRAWEGYCGKKMPGNLTYQDAGNYLVEKLGAQVAQLLIMLQSNDPNEVEAKVG